MNKLFAIAFILICSHSSLLAQSDSISTNEHFSMGSDFVSSYIWRGSSLVSAPCVQPYVSASCGNFTIEAWGSNAFVGGWFETDLSLMYENDIFRAGITDYYFTDDMGVGNYFIYDADITNHILEAAAEFKGTEKLPFRIMAASFLLGSDLNIQNKRLYSTYLEAGWLFCTGKTDGELKLGFTPAASAYASGTAWVQAALRLDRTIKVNSHFYVPIFSEFIVNPYLGDVFFFVGFTLGS